MRSPLCLVRAVAIVTILSGLIAGCSEEKEGGESDCPPGAICDPIDAFYTIVFDLDYHIPLSVWPEPMIRNEVAEFEYSVLPLYSGIGHFYVHARMGNGVFGSIEEPVVGEFGTLFMPVEFVAGEPASIRLSLRPTTWRREVGIAYSAHFDSILIDGIMRSVTSEEYSLEYGLPPLYMAGDYGAIVEGEL